ncbi:MAG TPA: sigma-70 family RNA polymerase sigma factor [Longimicrobiaceae bacterium]|nr:sigma-70 family RNA polymerase sigma factor [Longimicrobiaceae bacterium]
MSEEVAHLLGRAQCGDPAAVERLVRLHLGAAYAVALAVTGDPTEAEDVVQDAMVAALARLGDVRRPEGFAPWLMQIVRNRSKNVLRSRTVRAALPLEAAAASPDGSSPARDAERADLRDRLREGLATLTETQREVVLMHDMEGWKHREIGAALGLPEGTVRHHLFNARRSLRAFLGALFREDG